MARTEQPTGGGKPLPDGDGLWKEAGSDGLADGETPAEAEPRPSNGELLPELNLVEEPSEDELARIEQQLAKPAASQDLVDDPVRMYLRDIGQVDLLAPHQEVWVCMIREAADQLNSSCPEAATLGDPDAAVAQQMAYYKTARTAWNDAGRLAREAGLEIPAASELIDEVIQQQRVLISRAPSALYAMMGPNQWGDDPQWRPIVTELLATAITLYLLRPELVEYIRDKTLNGVRWPTVTQIQSRLPAPEDAADWWRQVR